MKQYYVFFPKENAYLVRYKLIRKSNEFVFTINDWEAAEIFDEDDCILELLPKSYEIELIPINSDPIEEITTEYDWI